jgi:hypothetical protein
LQDSERSEFASRVAHASKYEPTLKFETIVLKRMVTKGRNPKHRILRTLRIYLLFIRFQHWIFFSSNSGFGPLYVSILLYFPLMFFREFTGLTGHFSIQEALEVSKDKILKLQKRILRQHILVARQT